MINPMIPVSPEIRRLMDPLMTPIEAVYEALASSMPGYEGFGSSAVAKGKAAFENAKGRLRKELCPRLKEPEMQSLVTSQQSSDGIALAAVIGSILGSSTSGLALNATILAVLVVRIGVRQLCSDLPQ